MNKKMSKRQRDIKSKLMAAICMLLVSSIMMVSTTYAWFTLSTAPEVTGITTAVGANGNLEMALMPEDALTNQLPDYGIKSDVGDSAKDATIKNVTWGNLVDLSNSDFYGMDDLVLYPAALNVATMDETGLNPGTIAEAILKTPAYGADGRVYELKPDTTTSIYDSGSQSFPQQAGTGVRAVGTASGMTDRQLAYRNYRSAASTAMAQAKTFASQSLNINGVALANIAMAHAVAADATHTQADINALKGIVNDLLGTQTTTGVLQYVENAYKNYIIAYAASAAAQGAIDDIAFATIATNINAAADIEAVLTLLDTHNLTAINTAPLEALAATKTTVQGALNDLNALTGDAITWGEISVPLNKLAKTDSMEINGIKVSEFKERMGEVVADVAGGKGLIVSITSGGGVYADVADHSGNYTASVTLNEVSYGGITVPTLTARMETKTSQATVYLSALSAIVEGAGSPTGGTGQVMPISDFYGYIIDLAFRTNAAESNLLLQTTPADRIYSDNKDASAETMGHGSTMTFTSTTTDFTAENMKNLMQHIRIVFFDPSTREVLATAMLDHANATTGDGGTSVTANIYLYENKGTATTYEEATVEEGAEYIEVPTYRPIQGAEPGTHISDDDGATFRPINDGETGTHVVGAPAYEKPANPADATHKAVTVAGGAEMKKDSAAAIIAPLVQNTAKAVSALVYLDGESVTNADVAATAATSMTGSMNLQFASSANLVPMNYTPLMSQGTTETTEATEAPEVNEEPNT